MSQTAIIAQFHKALSWLAQSEYFHEFAKAFCAALGKAAGKGIFELFTDLIARSKNTTADKLTKEEQKLIRKYSPYLYQIMMSNYSILSRIIAKVRFTGPGGIIIVGPSGAGKSSLRDILTIGSTHEHESTKKITTKKMLIPRRYVRLADSPGDQAIYSADRLQNLLQKRKNAKILIAVLAAGLLENREYSALTHPSRGHHHKFSNAGQLVANMMNHEIEWINNICSNNQYSSSGFSSFMVCINKLDQWKRYLSTSDAVSYYNGTLSRDRASTICSKLKDQLGVESINESLLIENSRSINSALRRVSELYCIPETIPSLHPVSTGYLDFHGKGPADGFAEEITFSQAVLRLNIALRWLHLKD